MATAMQQAIAAAKRNEKKKKKSVVKEPAVKSRVFQQGEKVLYWSESKVKWVEAEVLRLREKDGAEPVYDLNIKSKAPLEKVRAPPQEGEAFDFCKPPPSKVAASTFVSFDAFDDKQAKKRGRDSDSEEERRKTKTSLEQTAGEPRIDWTCPPAELRARDCFQESDAAKFIDHFVRYIVGAWEECRRTDFPGFSEVDRAAFGGSALEEAKEAMVPLLVQLARGEKLERGETKGEKIKMSGGRAACDGRHVDEAGVLEQLDRMASSATIRDYADAHKAYMKLTLGHKKWNNTCVTHVSASTMSGAREYRRNRDSLNTYDMDPVAQKYMQGMRRIVHFAQRIRPNDDQSKNVVI